MFEAALKIEPCVRDVDELNIWPCPFYVSTSRPCYPIPLTWSCNHCIVSQHGRHLRVPCSGRPFMRMGFVCCAIYEWSVVYAYPSAHTPVRGKGKDGIGVTGYRWKYRGRNSFPNHFTGTVLRPQLNQAVCIHFISGTSFSSTTIAKENKFSPCLFKGNFQ